MSPRPAVRPGSGSRFRCACTAIASIFAAAPGAAAQGPAPARDPALAPATLPWPTDHVLTDATADGTIWAAAPGWKAGFAADGVTFVPFVGSDVPSQPVTFALQSLMVDGVEVPARATGPVQQGQRVTFDRGAVRECYDLRQDGIEQQFAIDALPARGAIELRIAVTGAFTADRDGDGFSFKGARGGVRYGRATAIDAAGQRLDLATDWDQGALRITVPASFTAEAARLPLTVDPMIGAITALVPSALELRNTDIAFDASLGQYVVVYERSFSATDHDVYVALLDAQMQPLGLLTIDYTTAYWTKPRIAVLEAHDQACVIAQTSTGNAPPWAVRVRRIDLGANPVVQPVQAVADLALNNALDPDIGGDANPVGPSRYLLVFEWGYVSSVNLSSSLSYQQMAANGTFSNFGQLGHPGYMRRPAVSKSCGLAGGGSEGWAMVYFREPTYGGTGPLTASFVGRSGTLLWPNGMQFMTLANNVDNTTAHWAVSSVTNQDQGRHYLCAERRIDQANGRGAILGHVFDRLGNLPVTGVTLADSSRDRGWPVADTDGCRFAVAHTTVWSATDVDVRVNTFAFNGSQLLLQDTSVPASTFDRELSPSLCAAIGAGYNLYGMSWVHQSGGSYAIECQRYRGVASGGIVSRATGCGQLTIQATGTVAIGETCAVAIANPSGLTGFVAGTPTSAPIGGCPSCTQGAAGFTMLGASLPIAVPVRVDFVGMTVAVQAFAFAASGQPCLGQLRFSNTLDLTVQ